MKLLSKYKRWVFAVFICLSLLIVYVLSQNPSRIPEDGRLVLSKTYTLDSDFILKEDASRNYAFKIEVDEISIDLNGHKIKCEPRSGKDDTFGILGTARKKIQIKNGYLEGCVYGVHLSNSDSVTLENISFHSLGYLGINLGGNQNKILNSSFENFGGYRKKGYTVGINNPGNDCVIQNNTFKELYRQQGVSADVVGEGVGIIVSSGTNGCVISDNSFTNKHLKKPSSIGIWGALDTSINIERNTLHNIGRGIVATDGSVADNQLSLDLSKIKEIDDRVFLCAIWVAGNATVKNNTIQSYPEIPNRCRN